MKSKVIEILKEELYASFGHSDQVFGIEKAASRIEALLPTPEEIKQTAEKYADSIERRGCSYWKGLFDGYLAGQIADSF